MISTEGEKMSKKAKSSDSKLWLEVPSESRKGKRESEGKEVRPTITTLLRHHQVLEKQERDERARVEGFLQGGPNWDHDAWRESKDRQDQRAKDATDAKRFLKSKLAYHKAIQATRQLQDEKQQAADSVRQEGRRLKGQLEEEEEVTMERRRQLAAELKEEMWEPRRQNEELQLEKRRAAQELKEETIRLQNDARRRDLEDLITRKERIQRIQASKMAMRQSESGSLSPAAFLGALGSPHAEIKLKLTKEAQARELEDKRRKVQETKEQRQAKITEVEHKVTSHLTQSQAKRQLTSKFKDIPSFKYSIHEDQEVNQLARELEKLKRQNMSVGTGSKTNPSRKVLNK